VGRVTSSGQASLSQGRRWSSPCRCGHHAAGVLHAAVVQSFNLSDPGVDEALYESAVLRRFVGVDLRVAPGRRYQSLDARLENGAG
jgi:hypothetical protein